MAWAHLLSFNLRFLAGVLLEHVHVTTGSGCRRSSGRRTFGCPRGDAVGVRVDAGQDEGSGRVVMSVAGVWWS